MSNKNSIYDNDILIKMLFIGNCKINSILHIIYFDSFINKKCISEAKKLYNKSINAKIFPYDSKNKINTISDSKFYYTIKSDSSLFVLIAVSNIYPEITVFKLIDKINYTVYSKHSKLSLTLNNTNLNNNNSSECIFEARNSSHLSNTYNDINNEYMQINKMSNSHDVINSVNYSLKCIDYHNFNYYNNNSSICLDLVEEITKLINEYQDISKIHLYDSYKEDEINQFNSIVVKKKKHQISLSSDTDNNNICNFLEETNRDQIFNSQNQSFWRKYKFTIMLIFVIIVLGLVVLIPILAS